MKRIVVGVDGSPGSAAALRFALDLARDTGADVEAVNAWQLSFGWIDGGYWPDTDRWCDEAAEAARQTLDRAVTAALDSRPMYTEITRTVVEGQAAQVLMDAAKDADVLVVGSRGRGGFAGLLLGSVSQQCVHHSKIPVVVVPEPS